MQCDSKMGFKIHNKIFLREHGRKSDVNLTYKGIKCDKGRIGTKTTLIIKRRFIPFCYIANKFKPNS